LVSDSPINLSINLISHIIHPVPNSLIGDLETAWAEIAYLRKSNASTNSQLLLQHLHVKKLVGHAKAASEKKKSVKAKLFVNVKGCHLTDHGFVTALQENLEVKVAKNHDKSHGKKRRSDAKANREAVEVEWHKRVALWGLSTVTGRPKWNNSRRMEYQRRITQRQQRNLQNHRHMRNSIPQ